MVTVDRETCQCENCIEWRKIHMQCAAVAYYNNQRDRDLRCMMQRRVAPDSKKYKWSVGYNKACGYYSAGFDVPRYSGSSLNRKHKKDKDASKEEMERKEANGLAGLERKGGVEDVAAWSEYRRFIFEARIAIAASKADTVSKGRYRGGLPTSFYRGCISCYVCGVAVPVERVHMLSARSKSKVRDKATAFYRACPGRRCFVTLTFVSKVSDSAAISILNKFLTALGKKYKDFEYLWVAERQTKNVDYPDNIHFHLIVNRRLPVATFNPLWVLQQYNAGLRAKNKYGREISMEEIRRRYKEKTVGAVLNPFDIKKVVSINNLSAYLTKYIVKQAEGTGFACAPWHCSRGVSRLFIRSLCHKDVFEELISKKNWVFDKETGEIFEPVVSRGDFWMCVNVSNKNVVLPYLSGMELINKYQLADPDFLLHLQDWRNMFFDDDDSYNHYFIQGGIALEKGRSMEDWNELAKKFALVDLSKN